MHVLQKIGTYSECHSAWSVRPTCQSLRCDITAVGTYWYHSDWLWPLTNRCTTAVFRPLALTGTARSLYSPMQSHGRWHLLALQSYCVNHSTNFKQKVIQLRNNYTIQGYTMQRLHNKVTQLSSNHLANKKVHYLQTADSQDNILPRGGLWN